jgi:hypothetical protein
MAASTGPREAARKPGQRTSYKIGAVKINKGTVAFGRVADGFAYPARTTANTTDVFLGVAFQTIDNSAGVAGATNILVEKSGSYVFALATTQVSLGQPVYASDDQTLTLASSTSVVLVGYIEEIIDAANVRVRIDRAVQ